jgi:hypothetical protein
MKYLIFSTFAAADARNQAEALARGCDPATTSRWWAHVDHSDGRAALAVDDPVIILDDDGYEAGVIPHSYYTGEAYNVNEEVANMVDELDETWFSQTGEVQ